MSNLQKVFQAIQKLAKGEPAEQAIERARTLPQHVDTQRYAPTALARAAMQKPAAQRGFSESLVSQKAPFATTMMTPEEFLSRAAPFSSSQDALNVEKLKPSLKKDGMRDLPLLWMEQYPSHIEAGYEGRHRMEALRQLYGNDPVLMNLIKGSEFDLVDSPYYKEQVRKYKGEMQMSPLELMRQKIMFGDRPVDLEPLWMGE